MKPHSLSPLVVPDLICSWDFTQSPDKAFTARGPFPYVLRNFFPATPVQTGAVGAHFGPQHALYCPRAECPALDLRDAVTIVVWLRREVRPENNGCEAVAGMWNEHAQRQYCLFLNLAIHDSAQQVGAHVSTHGGATPGFKYCMDAAIGDTPVPFGQWVCATITYDGREARAYLNGTLDVRSNRNPWPYPGCLHGGEEGAADFTVGAVARPEKVDEHFVPHGSVIANAFRGEIRELAVFARALTETEIAALAGVEAD